MKISQFTITEEKALTKLGLLQFLLVLSHLRHYAKQASKHGIVDIKLALVASRGFLRDCECSLGALTDSLVLARRAQADYLLSAGEKKDTKRYP